MDHCSLGDCVREIGRHFHIMASFVRIVEAGIVYLHVVPENLGSIRQYVAPTATMQNIQKILNDRNLDGVSVTAVVCAGGVLGWWIELFDMSIKQRNPVLLD